MGRLTRYTILIALSLSCASFCLPANAQTNLQGKVARKPTGSISGRVTVKGKGKGGIVVGVRIGDSYPQMGPLRKATTDADGKYHIPDLPAGNYQVMPGAPAFIVLDFNSFGRQGKSVILTDGENVEDIDFSMVRGGVITGRVSGPDGRPIIEERINIVVAEPSDRPEGDRQLGPGAQTDDRGIYRIFGLVAGKYKVFTGEGPDGTGLGRSKYERVYYPDVKNPTEAKVVELSEGSEAVNIDITVGESIKGFAAAGVVIDGQTNQPLPNLRFVLRRLAGDRPDGFVGTSVVSDRLGAFRFEGLAPGKYTIVSSPQPNNDLRSDTVTFDIVDQDVTGLTLKARRGSSVSGTVVLEGTSDKTIQSKIAKLSLFAFVRTESAVGGGVQTTTIAPDGSFRVGGLQPGIAQFQLTAQDRRLLTGFVISRVERDGAVVTRGLEIKSDEQVVGVKVVVVYGNGIVRGMVKLENGPLPTGARIMLRLSKPDDPSVMVRPQEADARGRFAIEGVPAGSYELFVSVFIPGSRVRQPFTKQSVSVVEGSVVEVEPVIDLEATQPPRP